MRRASLNHVYRLVWSDSRGAYVAVAETAGTGGKRSRLGRALAVMSSLMLSTAVHAQGITVAPGQAATVTQAANGVSVLNIAGPSGDGISHNRFNDYNVNSAGLVLNNIRQSAVVGTSQLAGSVLANQNLGRSADVILNEVISTNPSVLAGYTEVAGPNADVIVANPYGITCDGCGFINTSRATLTTGTPTLDGESIGFTVNSGHILVTGQGLDATRVDVLDLVARSVRFAGQVNAKDLNIVAGSNVWNRDDNTTQSATATTPAPEMGFDSTALGGMYAGRITVRVTEAGAGVRMLGNAAATAGDLRISAAGQLEIGSAASATRDVVITTTDASNTALTLDDAALTAGQDLRLAAQNGGIDMEGGLLFAARDLDLAARTLTDSATNTALTDNNLRYAGRDADLSLSGAMVVSQTDWGAARDLTANANGIQTGAGVALFSDGNLSLNSGTGDLALGAAMVSAEDNLSLTSGGKLSTLAGNGQMVRSASGALRVQATNLDNAGDMSTDVGDVTLQVTNNLINSGDISSAAALIVGAAAGARTASLDNSGTLVADGRLQVAATSIDNEGGMQGAAASTITADTLDNDGLVVASGSNATLELTVAELVNTGVVQSLQDLVLKLSRELDNQGSLFAGRNLSLSGGASLLTLSNGVDALIQAGKQLNITAQNASLTDSGGQILGDTVALSLAGLSNAGLIQSAGTSTYGVTGALTNSGVLLSGSTLGLTAASFNNQATGLLQSRTGATLNVSGQTTNAGDLILSLVPGADIALSVNQIANTGVIQTAAGLTLNVSGTTLDNRGTYAAGDDLTINALGASLAIHNIGDAAFIAGGDAGDQLTINDSDISLITDADSELYGNTVSLNLASLTNAGFIQSAGASTYATTGALTNSGVLLSGGTLDLSAASFNNRAAGVLQSRTGTRLNVSGQTSNAGTLTLSLTPGMDIALSVNQISNSGVIQTASGLTLNVSGSTLDNQGTYVAGDDLTINALGPSLAIRNTGDGAFIAGSGAGDELIINDRDISLTLDANSELYGNTVSLNLASLSNAGRIQSTANSTYAATGAITNGGVLLSGGTLGLTAASFDNQSSGVLQSGTGATLNVSGQTTNAGDLILSVVPGMDIALSANQIANTGLIQTAAGLTLNVSGTTLDNRGTYVAGDDLRINALGASLAIHNIGDASFIAGSGAGDELIINDSDISLMLDADSELYGNAVFLNLASLTNAGRIQSVTDSTYATTGALSNSGVLLSGATLGLTAASFDNQASGVLQSRNGATLNVSGQISNAGDLILSTAEISDIALNAGTLQNTGVVQATMGLTLNLSGGTLRNEGTVVAGDDLRVNASGGALTVQNLGSGLLIAGDDGDTTDATGDLVLENGAITLVTGVDSELFGDTVSLSLASLTNAGLIQSVGASTYGVTGALTNSGILLSGGTLGLTAASFDNQATGVLQSRTGATLNVSGQTTNAGDLILSVVPGADIALSVNQIANTGVIQTAAGLTLNVSGTVLDNRGTYVAGDDLTINALGASLAIHNIGTAAFIAGEDAGDELVINDSDISLVTDADSELYGNAVSLTLASLSNAGRIQSEAASTFSTTSALSNSGFLLAGGALGLTAASFDNLATGVLQSQTGATLNVSGMTTNAGALILSVIPGADIALSANKMDNTGIVQTAAGLTLNVTGTTLDNRGTYVAGDDLTINALGASLAIHNIGDASFIAGSGAGDQLIINDSDISLITDADSVLFGNEVSLTLASLNNSGGVISGSAGTGITVTNALTNSGLISSGTDTGGGSAIIRAGSLSNQGVDSVIQSTRDLTLIVGTSLSNQGGLFADDSLRVQASGAALTLDNTGTGLIQAGFGNGDVLDLSSVSALVLNNLDTARLAANRVDISSATLTNNGSIVAGAARDATGLVGTSTIQSSGDIRNGGLISFGTDAGGSGQITAGTLSNTAGSTLQSQDGLRLNLGTALNNAGRILAANPVIQGSGSTLVINNTGTGLIQAGSANGNVLSLGGQPGVDLTVNNRDDARLAGNQVNITAASLINEGSIVAGAARDASGVAGTSTISSVAAITNDGLISFGNANGGSGVITTTSFTNAATGDVQSFDDLQFNLATALINGGGLFASGDLTLNSTGAGLSITNQAGTIGVADSGGQISGGTGVLLNGPVSQIANLAEAGLYGLRTSSTLSLNSFNNAGRLQWLGGNALTVADSFVNSGTVIFNAGGGSAASSLQAQTFDNSGTILSSGDFTTTMGFAGSATDASFINSGDLLSTANLVLLTGDEVVTLTDNGSIQAANLLQIAASANSTGFTITINTGGRLYGDTLALSTNGGGLTNGGSIQAATSGNIDLGLSGASLNNSGQILLGNNGATDNGITANRILNQPAGTISSTGTLRLDVNNELNNSGSITTSGAIFIRGASFTDVRNSGTLWAGGELDIKRIDGLPRIRSIINSGNGVIRSSGSGSFASDLQAETFTLQDSATIQTFDDLTIDAGRLTISTANNRIIGSSGSTAGTTQISMQFGGITTYNNGLLASGGRLTLNINNQDSGLQEAFRNTSTGGILANNQLGVFVSQGDFFNQGSIFGQGDVSISIANGSGDKILNAASDTGQQLGVIETNATLDLTNNSGSVINNSRVSSVGTATVNAATFFNGTPTLTGYTPTLISDGTLRINVSASGTNQAGVLSGSNVAITGVGGSAVPFVNDSLSSTAIPVPGIYANNNLALNNIAFTNIGSGSEGAGDAAATTNPMTYTPLTGTPNGGGALVIRTLPGAIAPNNDMESTGTPAGSTDTNLVTDVGADFTVNPNGVAVAIIDAPSIDATVVGGTTPTGGTTPVASIAPQGGGAVINPTAPSGGAPALNPDAPDTTPATPVTAADFLALQPTINLGDVNITLPTNPNGRFVPSQDPLSGFLVVTNPALDGSGLVNAVGSDFLINALGLNPGVISLRLGDSAYENYIIRDQLVAQTNVSLLDGYADQNAMVASLYASAADTSKQLNLVWGTPLSAAQQASLTEDIVWMVETNVGGVKVLAPVVYLSPATKLAYAGKGGVRANTIAGNVQSFENIGGMVVAQQSINLTSVKDIANTQGGTISSQTVKLRSTEGSITNNEGALITGDLVNVDAAQNVDNTGGRIKADRFLGVTAGQDVVNSGGRLEANIVTLDAGRDVDNAGGEIKGGDYLGVNAGRNVVNNGGTIQGDKTVVLTARENIENRGGKVAGQNVFLEATEGELLNQGGRVTGKTVDLEQRKSIDTTQGGIETRSLGLRSTGGGVDLSGVKDATERLAVDSRDDIVNRDNKIESEVLTLRSRAGSVTNERGELVGTKTLTLDAQKDVNNLGGTLRGGDVTLKAREGSVTSKTLTREDGRDVVIDSKANIEATRNLNIDAKQDINIIGSDVSAEKNARLKAGNNVNIETVVEKRTTDYDSDTQDMAAKKQGTRTTSTTTTNTNVGSNIKVGETLVVDAANDVNVKGSNIEAGQAAIKAGKDITIESVVDTVDYTSNSNTKKLIGSKNSSSQTSTQTNVGSSIKTTDALVLDAGNDITIAASDVDVGGDLYAKAGRDVSVVDRQDTATGTFTSKESGFGVGGAFWGDKSQTTTKQSSTSSGSSLKVGGDSVIKGERDVNVVGSQVDIGGNSIVDAGRDINVLDGQNTSSETTATKFKSVLGASIGGDGNKSNKGSKSNSAGEAGKTETEQHKTSTKIKSEIEKEVENKADVNFSKTTNTLEGRSSTTSVGSSIKSGGSSSLKAGETIRLKGSDLESGGDMEITANDLIVTTGINTETTSTETKSKAVGIFTENSAKASAKGEAAAYATGSVSASSAVSAEAKNVTTIGAKKEEGATSTSKLTNTSSSIKSGGNLGIDVKNKASFTGANVEAKDDLSIKAGELENLAAVDSETTTEGSRSSVAGLYVSGEAKAEASAQTQASPLGTSTSVAASVSAKAGAGLRKAEEESSETSGSTTNVVNTFKAGGNLTRDVKGTIRDQGTQLEAGGDITQTATRIIEDEISDTEFSSKDEKSRDARVGIYTQVGADASAGAQAGVLTGVGAGGGAAPTASSGIEVMVTEDQTSERTTSSKAVTSSYKAGGAIKSTTTGSQKFVGTNMSAGKGIEIEGETVEILAARNTDTWEGSESNKNASAQIALAGEVGFNVSGGTSKQAGKTSSSEAVVGSLSGGAGDIKIKAKGDTTLEGTQLQTSKKVILENTEGSANLLAAKSTATETTRGSQVQAGAALAGKLVTAGVSGGKNSSDSTETLSTVTDIKASGVEIVAKKSATLEGTTIKAGKDGVNIDAENINLLEAKDTEKTEGLGISAGGGLMAGKAGKGAKSNFGQVGVNFEKTSVDKEQGNVVKIDSEGGINLNAGQKVVDQEADLGKGSVGISGERVNLERTDKDKDVQVGMGIDADSRARPTPKGAKKQLKEQAKLDKKVGYTGNTTDGPEDGLEQEDAGPQQTQSTAVEETEVAAAPTPPPAAVVKVPPVKVIVSMPEIPQGATVTLEGPKGEALPKWVTFNPATGVLGGTPPADFKGTVKVMIQVPQPDGSVQSVPASLVVK
jgi:filamentous hemagglutinin